MSTTDFLVDVLTSHQIYLQRYAGSANKEIDKGLKRLSNTVIDALGDAATVEDLVGVRARIRRMMAETEIGGQFDRIVNELPAYEVSFFQETLERTTLSAVNLLAPESVAAIVTNEPMLLTSTTGAKQYLSVSEAVAGFTDSLQNRVINTIRAGVADGAGVEEIARGVNQIVNTRSRRQAHALVRTTVNHIGSVAREKVTEINQDIIERERFVATLDSQTTLLCASLDGTTYPVGVGPRPPLHWGCRSIRIPVVDLGLPGLEGDRPARGASGTTTVKGDTKYSAWLRRQPREFIEDVLGPGRAKLFIDRNYSLGRFIGDDYKTLTLEELAAKDKSMVSNIVSRVEAME